MDRMQVIYQALRDCMIRVTVKNKLGDLDTGAAFHIGDGYFATARHVIDGFEEIELEHSKGFADIEKIEMQEKLLLEDDSIDVAVIKTQITFTDYYLKGLGSKRSGKDFNFVPLGVLLDDTVSDDHILGQVLLMGYPPIPMSDDAELVAVKGEINASIVKYVGHSHYYHIISTVARGGFSGGPVIDADGFLIGVYTESLNKSERDVELGFSAVLSIDPLLQLLKKNGIKFERNFNYLYEDQSNETEDYFFEEYYDTQKRRVLGWAYDRLEGK
jgi:hypothetical protein